MNPTALFRRSPTWSSTDADRRSDRGVGHPLSAARGRSGLDLPQEVVQPSCQKRSCLSLVRPNAPCRRTRVPPPPAGRRNSTATATVLLSSNSSPELE